MQARKANPAAFSSTDRSMIAQRGAQPRRSLGRTTASGKSSAGPHDLSLRATGLLADEAGQEIQALVPFAPQW
jgi:hypothetical protein